MKKGDRVYRIREWTLGFGYWEEFVVDSMGKKQATLRRPSGSMLLERIFSEQYGELFLVSETPDPKVPALEVAQKSLDREIAILSTRFANNPSKLERTKALEPLAMEHSDAWDWSCARRQKMRDAGVDSRLARNDY